MLLNPLRLLLKHHSKIAQINLIVFLPYSWLANPSNQIDLKLDIALQQLLPERWQGGKPEPSRWVPMQKCDLMFIWYYAVVGCDRLVYNWMSGGFQLRPRVKEPYDYVQKIIIIGDSGVGKSNILLRYTEGKFAENYLVTIGINYAYKIVEVGGAKLKLQIWDTAGQEKYRTITKTYYRNSQGVIVVFGLDNRDSFQSIRTFISIQMAG